MLLSVTARSRRRWLYYAFLGGCAGFGSVLITDPHQDGDSPTRGAKENTGQNQEGVEDSVPEKLQQLQACDPTGFHMGLGSIDRGE